MLMPNPSMKSIIFWQWANQSINVAINYSNANKTIMMSLKETATVGLTQAVPRLKFISPSTRGIKPDWYLCNCWNNRNGIDVYDADGNNLGKSQKAGANAVGQVAISRILTNFPVLTIPPLILSQLEKRLLKKLA
ncbi:2738_t:CDS:2 [Scutellospora calospora]|uniref:2738_t:CDS:1 n=1 Tax=Scutellospora calospora TaxID=85575 RepID=A0ACA9L1H6_9GLOM|nr:2738_t:CDS:2 [Scutellospora calospora]